SSRRPWRLSGHGARAPTDGRAGPGAGRRAVIVAAAPAVPCARGAAGAGSKRRTGAATRRNTMGRTVFERIIAGELPCARVYEDELVYAFMDAGQINPGHVLVVSRRPYETLLDADDATAGALFVAARRIARAVEQAFRP